MDALKKKKKESQAESCMPAEETYDKVVSFRQKTSE